MDEQRPQTQFRKFKNPEQLTRTEMGIAHRMNKTDDVEMILVTRERDFTALTQLNQVARPVHQSSSSFDVRRSASHLVSHKTRSRMADFRSDTSIPVCRENSWGSVIFREHTGMGM